MLTARAAVVAGFLGCTAMVGCAPTLLSEKETTTPVRSETIRNRRPGVLQAERNIDDNGGYLILSRTQICTSRQEEVVRTATKSRYRSHPWTPWLYVSGLTLGVLGIWTWVDAPSVPQAGDPNTRNPVSRSAAYATGGVLTGSAVTALAIAIGSSIRATDEITDHGEHVVRGDDRPLSCKPKPAPGVALVARGGATVRLGATGDDGTLSVPWSKMRPFVELPIPPTEIAVWSDPDQVTSLPLAPARAFWARRGIDEAIDLAREDRVDDALGALKRARTLGASESDARRAESEIERTPTGLRRAREERAKVEAAAKAEAEEKRLAMERVEVDKKKHVALLTRNLKRGDLDGARREILALQHLDADVSKFEAAIDAREAQASAREAKRYIQRCREVSRARDAMSRVRQCDDECQKIQRRIEGDWGKLTSEKPTVRGLSDEQRQDFRATCQDSGCPACDW